MEHAIKKGNYVQLNWTLHSIAGSEFSLAGLSTRLYYANGSSRSLATGTTSVDNVLTWTFQPDAQWKSGDYDLLLEIYSNGSKLIDIHYPKAFLLLSESPSASAQNAASQSVDTTINILSSCDFNHFAPVVPVVGEDGKWYVNGVAAQDSEGNPVYAYPTLTIESDGTIVINKGRHNETSSDVLKDFINSGEEENN